MPRYFPDAQQFAQTAKSADVIPVFRQILGDRLTPVTAFEVLGRDEHAFLLESVVGGERIGRYSFIATGPSLIYFVVQGKAATIEPEAVAAAPFPEAAEKVRRMLERLETEGFTDFYG